ncbi:MAG: universal stress protein [Terracidiphilus sp.]
MSFANGLKTIVMAADVTGPSEAALEYARKLATAYGARIVLAYGIDPMEYAEVGTLPGRVIEGLTEEARAVLDKLSADLLREGIHSHSELRQGAVAQMLLDVIRQYQAGLIVIGTKGREGAGPVIVGAVAEQLVRLSPCPVLAVAADWNSGAFRPTPGGPVLLAMERNQAAEAAISTACSLAKTFARPLLLLHARSAEEAAAHPDPCADTLKEFPLPSCGEFPVHCGTPGPHGTAFALLARSRVPILCVPPE